MPYLTTSARWVLACLAFTTVSAVATAQPVAITTNTTVAPGDTFITPTAGGPAVPLLTAHITVANAATLTISGQHHIASLALIENSRARHEPAIITDTPAGPIYGLELTVDGNVSIEFGSGIDLTGLGYPAGQGPGRGQDATDPYRGGGGGYGGAGARSVHNSLLNLPRFESGPAYGSFREPRDFGSPGGASFGGVTPGGAGGGCLRLLVGGELNVNGFIVCHGAVAWTGASGSGGSVWASANSLSGTGSIAAEGGQSFNSGGGGRIAIQAINLAMGVDRIRARATGSGGDSGTVYVEAGTNRPLLRLQGAGMVDRQNQTPRPLTIDLPDGCVEIDHAMVVGSTVTIRCAELNVSPDSAIDTSEMGFPPNEGPGAGLPNSLSSGGGHGGAGGARTPDRVFGGQTYGSFSQPTTAGSGGGRVNQSTSQEGTGGGVIRLDVSGILTLDGELRSSGSFASPGVGGGAGGSIWVTAASLEGTGFVRANGRSYGGAGRIAIEALTSSISTAHFEARAAFAGPGSIYLAINGQRPKLTFDNGENGSWPVGISPAPLDINLPGGDVEFRGVALASNSVNISAENIVIHANAVVLTTGFGHAYGEGPGHGVPGPAGTMGGGGGHGGIGGSPIGLALGGPTYGSAIQPIEPGSGGATRTSPGFLGGLEGGGGTVRLIATNTLSLFGSIRSDSGQGGNVAGGSGGSIWITANTVEGPGIISANGRDVGTSSGGGGRIAIYACTNTLIPSNITATGPNVAEDGSIIRAPIAVELFPIHPPCFRGSVSLNATAAGVGTLSYQWSLNGQPLADGTHPSGAIFSGSHTATLSIENVSPTEAGTYELLVIGHCGSVTTQPAQLTLCLADADCDGDTDTDDIVAFFTAFDNGDSAADTDLDGDTDSDDIITFFNSWDSGC